MSKDSFGEDPNVTRVQCSRRTDADNPERNGILDLGSPSDGDAASASVDSLKAADS
jgi:hypothetical protein